MSQHRKSDEKQKSLGSATSDGAMMNVARVLVKRGELASVVAADCEYRYFNREEKHVASVLRWNATENRDKIIRPIRRNDDDGRWRSGQMLAPWLLYNLNDVLKSTTCVFVCEGEKSVDALRSIDIVATTSPYGAKSAAKADWSPLAGRDVVLWPDADAPGAEYAAAVSEILLSLQPPARVKIIRPAGLRDGGDAADWLEQRDAVEPEAMRDELHKMIENAEFVEQRDSRDDSQSDDTASVNEAIDDPHRLARGFIESRHTLNNRETTLRFYRSEFLVWTANAWRLVSLAEMKSSLSVYIKSQFDAANLIAQRLAEPGDAAPECRKVTRSLIENVVQALASLTLLPGAIDAPAWLTARDDDPPAAEMLAMQSQLLHLRNAGRDGCTITATPRFFSQTSLGFDYAPDATCPAWLQFLDSVWPTDAESVETLRQWFGYCLQDSTSLQKLVMLIGPPRSGKGTIARVLRSLLGASNIAAPTLGSLADQFGLASLVAKRVAIIADARLSGRADAVAVVERLLSITGEDAQDVQRKHQTTLAGVRLPVKFFILANELPNLRDTAGALLSRTVLLRMTRSFSGREDRGLESRLLAELPGILNWSLAGLQALRDRGEFVQPASARELLDDLEDLSSPVGMFIRDRCIVGPEFFATIADLFSEWQEWCKSHGRDKPGTEQTFGRDLRAALPQLMAKRVNTNGFRERGYNGIGIRGDSFGPHRSATFSIAPPTQELDSECVERIESRERNTKDRGPSRTGDDHGPRLNREDMPKLPPWIGGGG